jgi:uncharacterized protein YneF (UPF0154 family)
MMELTIVFVIVVFLLVITLGIQIQIRHMNKKIDELLDRKP